MANQFAGKALSETPALKSYPGKPAVRNFRGEGGNAGIIEARLAPLSYSTLTFSGHGGGCLLNAAAGVRRWVREWNSSGQNAIL